MKRLAIVGAGDLGKQIAHHANSTGIYKPVGFFDDYKKTGTALNGASVLGNTDEVVQFFQKGEFDELIIGVGYKHMDARKEFFDRFKNKIPFATIVHDSSYVDKSCKIGRGSIIYPGCTLDMNVTINDNVLLNTGCIIAHDTSVGNHSFLSPAVKMAGFVNVDEKVNLGIGTTVIDNINISQGVKTGGGAVVVNDLTSKGLYIGIPAKRKRDI